MTITELKNKRDELHVKCRATQNKQILENYHARLKEIDKALIWDERLGAVIVYGIFIGGPILAWLSL